MLKAEKGITLVALVITIIVLVILAGVSISILDQQGLIGNAKEATEKYKTKQGLENTELDTANAMIKNELDELNK